MPATVWAAILLTAATCAALYTLAALILATITRHHRHH